MLKAAKGGVLPYTYMRVQIDRFEDNGWAVLLPYPNGRRTCGSPKRTGGFLTSFSVVKSELRGAFGWRGSGSRLQDLRCRVERYPRRAAERSRSRRLRDQRSTRQCEGIAAESERGRSEPGGRPGRPFRAGGRSRRTRLRQLQALVGSALGRAWRSASQG